LKREYTICYRYKKQHREAFRMSRLALNLLLTFLGKRLERASQKDRNFRAALSRDRTIVIAAGDVAHHFRIKNRNISAGRGIPTNYDVLLRFDTPGLALRTFLSGNRANKIVEGAIAGRVELAGNLMTLLWFDGRIQQVIPIGNQLRPPVRFEGTYAAPRDDIAAADRITREPAVDALNPDWKAAWTQREKLAMPRVADGEPHKEL
jgi:hypothetical protein